ncbi:hypothetical protein DFZ56_19040 [Escherichia coli]|nr:hypothetical protein [Escherichia coli]EFD0637411.1 hypothetical protein [Escherichia coli]
MVDPFPESVQRISVSTEIKYLHFNVLYFPRFTILHKKTYLKLIIHLISICCVFRQQIRWIAKLKKTEFLFILFSSCIAVHPQHWRGLAVSFVKNPD